VADVIQQINDGRGPDILILDEIENLGDLERLRTEFLKNSNYQPAILIEGRDERGIDVGMLSRFPTTTPPKLYDIEFKAKTAEEKKILGDTRGILRADFRLPNGDVITILGVHFPNPSHPSELRTQAFESLTKIRGSLPADRLVVAGGDFNVTDEEEEKLGRFAGQSEKWLVSHRIGCKGCKGTEYYPRGNAWSFLDVLMFSKNLAPSTKPGWKLDPDSIQIANHSPLQMRDDGTPARFEEGKEAIGVSDHLPMAAQINYISK
jgi:endonuclease/exonuclease/phosphatase family metal-dependent hydrolase